MKTVACLALIVLGVSGCAVEASQEEAESNASEIVGGTTTTGHPAVGALVDAGGPFCTGTVVAPRVVVTAAHCLEGVKSAASLGFALGPSAFRPQRILKVAGASVHPQYDARNIRNDIAVLRLAADAPVTPVPIATKAPTVGQSLVFVGYGVSNGRTGAGFGTKRQVTMKVAQVGASQFAYAEANKNTCSGDSGGPAFATDASGNLTVAGVTSYGDAACVQYGVDTRTDVYAAFVKQAGGQ